MLVHHVALVGLIVGTQLLFTGLAVLNEEPEAKVPEMG